MKKSTLFLNQIYLEMMGYILLLEEKGIVTEQELRNVHERVAENISLGITPIQDDDL